MVDAETSRPQAARRRPLDAFNQDTEQARESIRKLAALDPAVCWPGHADAADAATCVRSWSAPPAA